jgi:PAS domain S-box-containing protein
MDASCKRIWVNKAFCDMMGYSREELLGGNFREVTDADDLLDELVMTGALARGERSHYQMEKRYIRKDGTPVWALVAGTAIRDEAGAVLRYVAHVQDISDRRKAAEEIRQSEELFRTTFDSAPIGIALAAPDGKRLWVNQAFATLLGYSREELMAATYREITHPADLDEDDRQLRRLLNGEVDHYETEKRFIRKDHRIIWGYFTATLVRDAQGSPQHFVGQIQDITQRKLAEEALRESDARLRSVVTTAPVVLFALDEEGVFTFLEGHALGALGVQQELLVGTGIWDQAWMTPAMTEGVLRAIEGTAINDVIALGERFFDVQITPTPRDGATLGVTGVMLDVTERRSLEAQLRRSQRLESLGQLAGGIAHDFNNLLTVINGHSELLIDSLARGDPMRDEVGTILEAGQRGSALTRQLLTFSRRQAVQPQLMDLNEVIQNLESMLRRLLGARVELTTDLALEIDQVNADPGQIEQVVMNLVINARDAMEDGGRVTVSTSRLPDDEAKVCLEVSDTGSGMSADVGEHIFDPFFTTKEHGTGLGLATVHGIVTQAGGEIDVVSTPGVGTTFTIRLPRAAGPRILEPERLERS